MTDSRPSRFPISEPVSPRAGVSALGKRRRELGSPVADPKEPLRFEPGPPPPSANFNLPLEVIAPRAAKAAADAGQLVFHCVGDTGGLLRRTV